VKEEHVFLIRMSAIQRKLYSEFMTALQASGIGGWATINNPIKAFSVCCKVGTELSYVNLDIKLENCPRWRTEVRPTALGLGLGIMVGVGLG